MPSLCPGRGLQDAEKLARSPLLTCFALARPLASDTCYRVLVPLAEQYSAFPADVILAAALVILALLGWPLGTILIRKVQQGDRSGADRGIRIFHVNDEAGGDGPASEIRWPSAGSMTPARCLSPFRCHRTADCGKIIEPLVRWS